MNKVILTISGRTGSGKTTLANRLCLEYGYLLRKVTTATTRPQRRDEPDDAYHFMTDSLFSDAVTAGRFIEHQKVGDYLYGVPLSSIDATDGMCSVVVLDFAGVYRLREVMAPHPKVRVISIFVDCDTATQTKRLHPYNNGVSAEIYRWNIAVKEERTTEWEKAASDFTLNTADKYVFRYQDEADDTWLASAAQHNKEIFALVAAASRD